LRRLEIVVGFFGTFAISSFLAAMLFHVFIVTLARLSSRIAKYGSGLVVKIGKALPRIDYADTRIPQDLKEKFRYYRVIWAIWMLILLSPMAVYFTLRKLDLI
jgi:hypothetical protein